MYERINERLRELGEGDAVHAASAIAVEFQSAVAAVLLVFLAARMISIYFAVPAALITLILLKNKMLTFDVFCENDDRFQTLLHYLVVTLALCLLLVGWVM